MKLPKKGDKAKYVEKIPQDDGVPPILQDVEAVVISIHSGDDVACKICRDEKSEHYREGREHGFEPQENTLVLDVSFSAYARFPAETIRREHVEYGTEANQWHK